MSFISYVIVNHYIDYKLSTSRMFRDKKYTNFKYIIL